MWIAFSVHLLKKQGARSLTTRLKNISTLYTSFCIPGIAKADFDGYITMVRPNVETLIEECVKTWGLLRYRCQFGLCGR